MKNKNETTMQTSVRILAQRARYYREKSNENGIEQKEYLNRAAAYENALAILHYALENNQECLQQFDYLSEIPYEEYSKEFFWLDN